MFGARPTSQRGDRVGKHFNIDQLRGSIEYFDSGLKLVYTHPQIHTVEKFKFSSRLTD